MRRHPSFAARVHLARACSAATCLLVLSACADAAPESPSNGDDTYAFIDVNVVPMVQERVLDRHTVVVQDGHIVAVGPAATTEVPPGARRIAGEGHYLIPGLAEMHGHIPGSADRYAENVLFLYVSNGVTTVRGMAGHPSHLELRERVARGDLIGPTIHAAGPSFSSNAVPSPAAAEARVHEQHAAGYDLLKVASMSLEAYERMASSAHELDIPFAGHVPAEVGLAGALEARQASIDHLDRYVEHLVPDEAAIEDRSVGFFGSGIVDLVDTAGIPEVAAATRESGVWNVPTLSLVEHLASPEPPEEMAQWPEMRYMPPNVLEGWVDAKRGFQARADFQPDAAQQLVELRRDLTRALHEAGAPLALGSDAPQFFNVPGFSIHHEMEMMVAAGLTPYDVLVTGTRNPALYFGTPDEFGTIEVGRRADLILLEANPLDDIANVRHRAGVMANGRWLTEREIQERLDTIAEEVRNPSD